MHIFTQIFETGNTFSFLQDIPYYTIPTLCRTSPVMKSKQKVAEK